MNYDPNKFRALGVGETVQQGDWFFLPEQPETVQPCTTSIGSIVEADDATTFLRPIETDGMRAIERIAAAYGIKTDIGLKALSIALDSVRLLDSKQQDYGSANIAAFGEYGVLVRVWDKVSRLRNLIGNVSTPKNESIMDSWVDLGNYAIIAQICRKGEWK